jgi:carotenoid 1,2-hydratase
MSDDQRHGITLIAFVGSVFSPYYAWARRRGQVNPEDHCALNVALYSPGAGRWCMTERGQRHCSRSAREFVIGPSRLHWDGQCLQIDIDERSAPLPRRVRGRIRLWPGQLQRYSTAIEPTGRHRWGPIAPHARIEVDLPEPGLRWQGHAYLDSNEGDEPVEQGFDRWDWSRAQLPDGSTVVHYDLQWPGQSPAHPHPREHQLSLRFDAQGAVEPLPTPAPQDLPRTAWLLARRMRSAQPVRVLRQLEDTPFYQRALLELPVGGRTVQAFHETLSVPRLVRPVVQAMLPFRMPRRG